MVPRPHNRRREGDEAGADADEDTVDLGAAEHAWWAQRPTEQAWTPRPMPPPEDTPPRDILAEHFGEDWRTSFGFDPPPAALSSGPSPEPEPEAEAAPPPPPGAVRSGSDPYLVLGVPEAASWDEIVTAHRALARAHHPDVVAQRPAVERAAAEDRIRELNIAYQALRVRRGR